MVQNLGFSVDIGGPEKSGNSSYRVPLGLYRAVVSGGPGDCSGGPGGGPGDGSGGH